MNTILKKELDIFLKTYLHFNINADKTTNKVLVLEGAIDIVDTHNIFWKSYNVRIVIPKLNYPHVIPEVFEISSKINRNIDFHISKDGKCCLDIHHKLKLEARKGINIIRFYKRYIYPFFANHQFKVKTKTYAGEEYEHDINGVIQYYREEFGLTDFNSIIKHIECSLGIFKAERNRKCPICNGSKYKKCCFKTVEKLKLYGNNLLKVDLEIFKSML